MALFGFSDIEFNKGSEVRKGPLSKLVDNQFQKTTFRYPLDIGNYDKAHYMVIYIREQKASSFGGTNRADETLFSFQDEQNQKKALNQLQSSQTSSASSSFGSEILGKINSGLGQINSATGGAFSGLTSALGKFAGSVSSGVDNIFGQTSVKFGGESAASQAIIDNSIKKITNNSFLKTTFLTKDAIALYMPDTLQYTYAQSYDQLSLGGELGGQALAAGASAAEAFKSESGIAALSSAGASLLKSGSLFVGKKISETAGSLGVGAGTAQVGFTAAFGAVQNPMLEMIYKSPNFRSFQFDFSFYPRDEREALEVQRIIERLRFHQAPELAKGAGGFLIPPSEFDIKFYYGGHQNPNIPPISTCILTSIDVNYAPNGFSSYEIPGENAPALGRTGMPVAIQLLLQFQETSYLTKNDFKNDSGIQTLATIQQNPDLLGPF